MWGKHAKTSVIDYVTVARHRPLSQRAIAVITIIVSAINSISDVKGFGDFTSLIAHKVSRETHLSHEGTLEVDRW